MKFTAVRVRNSDGRDYPGTMGMISGNYQTLANFLRYNRKHFADDTLYAVYSQHNENWNGFDGMKFRGFHSNLDFDTHQLRAFKAINAMDR